MPGLALLRNDRFALRFGLDPRRTAPDPWSPVPIVCQYTASTGPSGPEIEVPADTRCTRAPAPNEATHLTERVPGLLSVYDDDPPGSWKGAIVTIGECSPGEIVFADIGEDATPPHIWPCVRVCA